MSGKSISLTLSSLIFAAVMAGAMVPAAQADSVHFGVTVGDDPGYGGWGGDDWRWRHRGPPPPPRAWGGDEGYYDPPPPPPPRWGISCGEAAGAARAAGFRGVRATDCSRPVYEFEGFRRGRMFSIDVNDRGRIVSVDPLY